jgi:hypothetical protein
LASPISRSSNSVSSWSSRARSPNTTRSVMRSNSVSKSDHSSVDSIRSRDTSSATTVTKRLPSGWIRSDIASTASANARRSFHSSPRESVSASGWKCDMPLPFAPESDAYTSADLSRTSAIASRPQSVTIRPPSSRTPSPPCFSRSFVSTSVARRSASSLVSSFIAFGRGENSPRTSAGASPFTTNLTLSPIDASGSLLMS